MSTLNAVRQPTVRREDYIPAPEAQVSRKLGEVESEIVRIQDIIGRAHDRLSGLTAKLDPILSQPLTTGVGSLDKKVEPPSCPMAETLRQISNLADELVSRLSDVSERVRL